MSVLHIWTFSVSVFFLKQTKQTIEIYTGFAKNVSSIKMSFCNEKTGLYFPAPTPLLLTACTELFRKSGRPGYTGSKRFVRMQGLLHMQNHLWLLVPAWEPAHQARGAFACSLLRFSEGACSRLRS